MRYLSVKIKEKRNPPRILTPCERKIVNILDSLCIYYNYFVILDYQVVYLILIVACVILNIFSAQEQSVLLSYIFYSFIIIIFLNRTLCLIIVVLLLVIAIFRVKAKGKTHVTKRDVCIYKHIMCLIGCRSSYSCLCINIWNNIRIYN